MEIPINHDRLTDAFGSMANAQYCIGLMAALITDPDGWLVMAGSWVHGVCQNPNSFYGAAPDHNRRTDLDMKIICAFLFRDIKPNAIMSRSPRLSRECSGKVSMPLTYENGSIRECFNNPKLRDAINKVQDTTSRRVDMNIYHDLDAWLSTNCDYWVLHKR